MEWKDIDTAPKDGSPVWVEGNNYGDPDLGIHRVWAYWYDEKWIEARSYPRTELLYLTKWLYCEDGPLKIQCEICGSFIRE